MLLWSWISCSNKLLLNARHIKAQRLLRSYYWSHRRTFYLWLDFSQVCLSVCHQVLLPVLVHWSLGSPVLILSPSSKTRQKGKKRKKKKGHSGLSPNPAINLMTWREFLWVWWFEFSSLWRLLWQGNNSFLFFLGPSNVLFACQGKTELQNWRLPFWGPCSLTYPPTFSALDINSHFHLNVGLNLPRGILPMLEASS
jgi:hypothetical protein